MDSGRFEMSKLSEYLYGQGFTDDEIKDLIDGATPTTLMLNGPNSFAQDIVYDNTAPFVPE